MSTWRTETLNNSEKSLERVIDKMAAAAQALGWPEQIADTTRAQMESITKMQIQMMDQMMDAWEEQIKSPSPSSAILPKLKTLPTFSAPGNLPTAVTSQMAALNPFGVYMQIAQQWQTHGRTRWPFGSKPVSQIAGALNCETISPHRLQRR